MTGLSSTGVAESSGDDDASPSDAGSLVAHRGYAGVYPQNTRLAVAAAGRDDRTDMIEIDVMQTADETVVVFHDEHLGDLTDATGAVNEQPDDVVLDAAVLGTDQTIPTLHEVMEAIPPSVGLNVEFKHYRPAEDADGNPWLTSGMTRRTLAVLDEYPHEILVSSFDERALTAIAEVDDSVSTAFLVTRADETPVETARELGCDALHPGWPMVDQEFVNSAHDAESR